MLDRLEIFRMSQALAQHAGQRQAAIAQNMAHADTPNYRARDVVSFTDTYQTHNSGSAPRTTRARHLDASSAAYRPEITDADRPGALSPNGNNVSLEREMLNATEVKRQHDLALTVYRTSLNILRASLGRR